MSCLSPSSQSLNKPATYTSSQQVIKPYKHPKIKPLISHNSTKNSINEPNLQRKLQLSSSTSKAIKSASNIYKPSSPKYIKGIFKFLKAQNSLSTLSRTFANRPIFETTYLFSKLRDLSSLTSLQLQILGLYKFDISFKVLLKSLASLKNLACFHITFNGFPYKDKKIPQRFLTHLQNLKRIKDLSLSFYGSYDLKENFQNIVLDLGQFTHLQSLELSFYQSMVYNDRNIIKNLALVIPKLEELTKITLDLSSKIVIQGSDIVNLFLSLQNLKKLSDISLDLRDDKITSEPNIEPLSQGLAFLDASLVKKLKLTPYKNLDDQGFLEISQALKRFTSLTLIDFRLSESSLASSQWVSELGSILKGLKSLSSLSLGVPLLSKGAGDIGSLLRPLENLTDLKLYFVGKYKEEDLLMRELALGLKALKALKVLHIHFLEQDFLSNEAFETLVGGWKELTCLRNLSIKFSSRDVLTSKKAESLHDALKKLENLSDLCLDFGVSYSIDDEVIVKIAQVLRNLSHLYSVGLGLQQSKRIEEKEDIYRMLFRALEENKNIHQVTLHLTHSEFNAKEASHLEKIKCVEVNWKHILEFGGSLF